MRNTPVPSDFEPEGCVYRFDPRLAWLIAKLLKSSVSKVGRRRSRPDSDAGGILAIGDMLLAVVTKY
jgi:hypothetical protein